MNIYVCPIIWLSISYYYDCMFYVTEFNIYVYFGFVLYFTTWLKQFRYGLAMVLYYMSLYVCTGNPTATSAQRCPEDL